MLKSQGMLPSRKARRHTYRDWLKILGSLDTMQREMLKARQQAAQEASETVGNKLRDAIVREGRWYRRAWRGVKGVFRGYEKGV